MHADPQIRRRQIARLLANHQVRSQAELGKLLRADGISVNQGTLSRDLRELGVVKGPDGYTINGADAPAHPDPRELDRALGEWLVSAAAVQNQVVIHTPPSGAPPLALALDRASLDGVVGTIAGDDTVLAICTDRRAASSLANRIATGTEVSR